MSKRPGFLSQQLAFAAHLRDPERFPAPAGIEERRLNIYRELFFNNIRSLLAGTFPVLHRILGTERWAVLVRDFYRDHVSHTPLFHEIPQEFIAWLADEFKNDGQWPGFMSELAHYEWLELAVATDPREIDAENINPDGNVFEAVPVPSPVVRVAAYHYPVHRLGPGFQPDTPAGEPVFLAVFRRRDDRIGFMELNAVTALLLELVQDNTGKTGEALLEQLAKALPQLDSAAVIEGGREILNAMKKDDIIAGTRI